MGTPTFAKAQATPVIAATDSQITRALAPMIADRSWREAKPDSYVSRVAVLNLAIGWATAPMSDETPAEISRVINGTVGRTASYGERVNAILAHCSDQAAPEAKWLWKPLTKAGASALIDWLLGLPNKVTAPIAAAPASADVEVPAGRYAVDTNDGAVNTLAFYKVDRPTEGRWAGYVFVKLMQSDAEQRLSREASAAILAKIAEAGPAEASARYGHEIGECGVCGRTLTNDESRAYGIGPDCRKKHGW